MYHLGNASGVHCYQTNYTDPHYVSLGYVDGFCPFREFNRLVVETPLLADCLHIPPYILLTPNVQIGSSPPHFKNAELVDAVQTIEICKGHSEENTKYCPADLLNITVYKMGKA